MRPVLLLLVMLALAGCKTQQRVISREVYITNQSSRGANYNATTTTVSPRVRAHGH